MAPCFPHLPLELWHRILDIACNDDGTTARSLTLTSRSLQDASRYHRYRSVSIAGWGRVLAFKEAYFKAPHELRNISNLYIHLPELDAVGLAQGHPTQSSDLTNTFSAIFQLEHRVICALRLVLEASANSLRVLVLCWKPYVDFKPEVVFPILPKLSSLSIFEDSSVGGLEVPGRGTPVPVLFPGLDRLNISGFVRNWSREFLEGMLKLSAGAPLRILCILRRVVRLLPTLPDTVEEVQLYVRSTSAAESEIYAADEVEILYGINPQHRSRTAVYRRITSDSSSLISSSKLDWLRQMGCDVDAL